MFHFLKYKTFFQSRFFCFSSTEISLLKFFKFEPRKLYLPKHKNFSFFFAWGRGEFEKKKFNLGARKFDYPKYKIFLGKTFFRVDFFYISSMS